MADFDLDYGKVRSMRLMVGKPVPQVRAAANPAAVIVCPRRPRPHESVALVTEQRAAIKDEADATRPSELFAIATRSKAVLAAAIEVPRMVAAQAGAVSRNPARATGRPEEDARVKAFFKRMIRPSGD